MNTLTRIASTISLVLIGTTAHAELVCDNCIAPTTVLPYAGAYWPGDRGTFRQLTPLTSPGFVFDQEFVFDVNDAGRLALTFVGTELTNLRVELYDGSGVGPSQSSLPMKGFRAPRSATAPAS